MKKGIALFVALMMAASLAACGGSSGSSAAAPAAASEKKEEAAPAEEKKEEAAPAAEEAPAEEEAAEEEAPAEEAKSEEAAPAEAGAPADEDEAAEMAKAGTLVSDPYTGYEYSENTGNWYYSNYPNYKDFKEDGVVKVGFCCKFSGAWFTPKDKSLEATVTAAGYEYHFFDANKEEQAWVDSVEQAINQDYDVLVLTAVNTALMPDAVAMLQDAGIAYMTTDDPGTDASEFFYAPHYGLDDYFLHNELGKLVAQDMEARNFMEGVADDYSNLAFIIEDSPSVEAIHLRNVGFVDAILAAYPDFPEDQIKWLDCGGSLSDECAEKFSSELQARIATTDKWIVSAGGAASVVPTITLFKENGVPLENVVMADCFSTQEPLLLMHQDEEAAKVCYGAGLSSAPSGVGMGEIIIDLVENGTPIPGFTGYAFDPVWKETLDDFNERVYGGWG